MGVLIGIGVLVNKNTFKAGRGIAKFNLERALIGRRALYMYGIIREIKASKLYNCIYM